MRRRKKDASDHKKERTEHKRRAPKRPEQELSKKDLAAEFQRDAPPKPARKNKEANQRSSRVSEQNFVDVRLEKEAKEREITAMKIKEEARKREESDSKLQQQTSKANGAEEQKKQQERSDDKRVGAASAKKAKHVDKASRKEETGYQQTLQEIDECVSASHVDHKGMVFSPNSSSYKSVREKKSTKPRKNMRRSISFSEGHPPPTHKSGYNEEASSRYNVVTNCVTTAEEENKSNFDKIKALLDYAASQQNIVIQASQALNMSLYNEDRRGSPEIVEGERLLLLASERKTACLDEVEKLKRGSGRNVAAKPSHDGACPPCHTDLVLSGIKIPLNEDFLLALRGGRMDLGVFHFAVLIQYSPTQIHSTKVRCTYDELSRNFLTFKEKIELKNVPHDFILTVKVYGMHTKRGSDSSSRGKKQQTKDSPGLMKNVFSSLTPRRRATSADDSPVRGSSPKPVFRTTSFTPCGSTKINMALIKSAKHVLAQVPKNCPIEGFVELHIDCQPQFTASARGFLTILEEVGDYTAWNRRWCVMQGDSVTFWRFPDEETTKPSIGGIDLTSCVNASVDMIPRHECSRPNTFELIVKRPLTKTDSPSLLATIIGNEVHIKSWLSADNKDDKLAWMETLNRQLSDSKAWSATKQRVKMHIGKDVAESSHQRNRSTVAV